MPQTPSVLSTPASEAERPRGTVKHRGELLRRIHRMTRAQQVALIEEAPRRFGENRARANEAWQDGRASAVAKSAGTYWPYCA